MAERLRRVAGALQAFQKADFQRLFLRFSAEGLEQPLQFPALRQVAGLVVVAQHQLAIFGELVRSGFS